ncbi:protein zer-1 homolog [Arapaima gigas]
MPPYEESLSHPSTEPSDSSIYLFRDLKRPLQFLGLYDTSLYNLTNIPAYKVTGANNDGQILNTIEAYTEFRPEVTHRAINHLFNIVRIQHCSQSLWALQLVIAALKFHKCDKNIQVTGNAALFYVTNMEYHTNQSEVTVQKNCCLMLCNFSISEELEFQYLLVSWLLLHILEPTWQDESIQRIATFPNKQELHHNMLELLGNGAKVKALRPQLLIQQLIIVFSNLLGSKADGIAVSYNACGVLSHIMYDGPEVWTMEDLCRDKVVDRMKESYPKLGCELLQEHQLQTIAPIRQSWAIWALYNLVFVYPSKYCPLLIKEGGMALLQVVLDMETSQAENKNMARCASDHMLQQNRFLTMQGDGTL